MRLLFQTCLILLATVAVSLSQSTTLEKKDGMTRAILGNGVRICSKVPLMYSPARTAGPHDEIHLISPENDPSFSWTLKFSRTGKVFKDVSFADPQTGFLVTELGAVYKTTDGGETWTTKLDLGFPYYWYGVEALSQDTVIISGFNNQDSINHGVVRWTFDGGDTWGQDVVLRIPYGVGWLEKVHFFNHETGIVMASFSGGVHYTSNGGKDSSSWNYVQINQDLGWFAGNIDAQVSGNVYSTGIHFAQSSNFGVSWNSIPSADNVFDGGVDFLDEDNFFGWTGGGEISPSVEGWVHRTTDGGQTWSPRLFSFPFPIRVVKFFNDTLGLVAGGNVFSETGGLYVTTDGGTSWELDLNTAAEMFSVETIRVSEDSVDIWCAGSTGGGTGFIGRLYKARIFLPSGITGINNTCGFIPAEFKLYDNYPNPFNPTTAISFDLPTGKAGLSAVSFVQLRVFDLLGQDVALLVDEQKQAGRYSVRFDGSGLGSGVYFYQLKTSDGVQTKKMLMVR